MSDTAAPLPDPPVAAHRSPLRRELLLFAAAGGFGVVLLPFLVYLAGAATLGPYEGGLQAFLSKLYGDLLHLAPGALGLLFGPYLLLTGLRILTRPLRRPAGTGNPRN